MLVTRRIITTLVTRRIITILVTESIIAILVTRRQLRNIKRFLHYGPLYNLLHKPSNLTISVSVRLYIDKFAYVIIS